MDTVEYVARSDAEDYLNYNRTGKPTKEQIADKLSHAIYMYEVCENKSSEAYWYYYALELQRALGLK